VPRVEGQSSGSDVHRNALEMMGAESVVDPVEAYFECITTCSLDDGECVTSCTEILRQQS
jgi:hypothetical protein